MGILDTNPLINFIIYVSKRVTVKAPYAMSIFLDDEDVIRDR